MPNGIDLPRNPRREPNADGSRRSICLGHLNPGTLDHIIDEFAALPAEAKAQLTILGDGQCRATFEEQAARLGLSSRVTFAGAVEDVFPFCGRLISIFRPRCRKACQTPCKQPLFLEHR
ncbi:glycosyltransferase [Mesorhizobium temperatum]|uniref:glycosyltransferase n=1 Tax=Mesorhizobium temperatum TaxID=241416 RepID=UPI00117EE6CF